MGRFFRCKLEFEEPATARLLANEERDRQIALLQSAVLRLDAGQIQLRVALRALLDDSSANPPTEEERDAAIESLDRVIRDKRDLLQTFNDDEFDRAERRKQALKARIRQMDEQRRARYAAFW